MAHRQNMKLLGNLRKAQDVMWDCDECMFPGASFETYWCDYHHDCWHAAFDALEALWDK